MQALPFKKKRKEKPFIRNCKEKIVAKTACSDT
jgi:hypothetical protein